MTDRLPTIPDPVKIPSKPPESDRGDTIARARGLGLAMSIGPMMAAYLLVGFGFGRLISRHTNLGDLGVGLGLMLGLCAGMRQVYRVLRKL